MIECQGGVGADGMLTAWDFTNINAGGAAIDTPYNVPHARIAAVDSAAPLAQGAYRCLAATGNNFARESFMDELAAAASSIRSLSDWPISRTSASVRCLKR